MKTWMWICKDQTAASCSPFQPPSEYLKYKNDIVGSQVQRVSLIVKGTLGQESSVMNRVGSNLVQDPRGGWGGVEVCLAVVTLQGPFGSLWNGHKAVSVTRVMAESVQGKALWQSGSAFCLCCPSSQRSTCRRRSNLHHNTFSTHGIIAHSPPPHNPVKYQITAAAALWTWREQSAVTLVNNANRISDINALLFQSIVVPNQTGRLRINPDYDLVLLFQPTIMYF